MHNLLKENINFFIGVDISAYDFHCSIFKNLSNSLEHINTSSFDNNEEGFDNFFTWFKTLKAKPNNSVICMEATGTYNKKLAYFLAGQNFKIIVEQPLKVKKAFFPIGHKNDSVDSKQIAEYAFRFLDRIKLWEPPIVILEKLKQLITTREQLVKQKVSVSNIVHAYKFQKIQVEKINSTQKNLIIYLQKQIEEIEKEINNLVKQDTDIEQKVNKLKTITGIQTLLSVSLLIAINSLKGELNYKKLSAYIAIAPYQHQSGSSVYKNARIPCFGVKILRKLLRLASQSVATHDKKFKEYYLRKQLEGKPKALVLNNIANKMLKVACAILRDNNSSYKKEHYSVNPIYV